MIPFNMEAVVVASMSLRPIAYKSNCMTDALVGVRWKDVSPQSGA